MIVVTRLVVYSLLSKKSNIDIQDVKDTIIKLSQHGVTINESLEEIEKEIDIVVNQLNLHSVELGLGKCVEVKNGKIMVRNDCSWFIAKSYENLKQQIKTSNTSLSTYGKTIISLLEEGDNI